ncbi:MAG TPA: NBR1-Ig-like domain-containing protein [Terriglobia bacterium]|nr:NBR1-Ig-like domain-containing protein [Terriglobia bacterium]
MQRNDEVSRGTVLGTRKTQWIHVSLDNRFRDPSKPPVPFSGEHTLEGISFEPGGDDERNKHVGRVFFSTNGSGSSEFDCAFFVRDLTHPDGTHVSPGENFQKKWQVKNCGTTTWSAYKAVRVEGIYGPESFDVPVVEPDELGELSANMTAPTVLGIRRATYQLKGPSGNFGDEFWVEIDVRPP